MSDPSKPGSSWEDRAADLANEIQRWLIRTSARNMRGELEGQVKKALRGPERSDPGDVWATATAERPGAAGEAPECAWCPVCRAARRVREARETGGDTKAAATLAEVSGVLTGAVRDVLAGLDSVLSYRPGDVSADKPADRAGAGEPAASTADIHGVPDAPGSDRTEEPEHESGDRG